MFLQYLLFPCKIENNLVAIVVSFSPMDEYFKEKDKDDMDITPLIPDGYTGPIKRLTCRICKHMFYITQDDYSHHPEVRFCHECSLILREELEKTQGASTLTPPPVREKPVARTPMPS